MTWIILLTAVSCSVAGWSAHAWMCSRRRDCPLYVAYALARWKRDVKTQIPRREKSKPGIEPPTPPSEELT